MKYENRVLDDKDRQILYGVRHGKTYKEIAAFNNINIYLVEKRLKDMRRHYNCSTTAQLIAHLILEGAVC
jgi:DNA-binding CsgD family transcriptional regulator